MVNDGPRTARGGGNRRGRRASFGSIRKLPSGRYQARYTGPDGREHRASTTFETKRDASSWLSMQQAEITRRTWLPGVDGRDSPTLTEFARAWVETRELKPKTRSHYVDLLDRLILPTLGDLRLSTITDQHVEDWHRALGSSTPTYRAHAYGLLRTIMGTAVERRMIAASPCRIRGAGASRRRRGIEPASLEEIAAIVDHMPDRYRAMVLVAAWCGLRFGEITELRRKDVDLARGVIRVSRAVTRVDGETIVGTPKSDAGVRNVDVPPHVVADIEEHLRNHVPRSPDALLFPAADGTSHLAPSTLYRVYYPAREAAGRPDLRWHDLRHTDAVHAAQAGATLAELMARHGHSTSVAALRYQHAARGRGAAIAAKMSQLAQDGADDH